MSERPVIVVGFGGSVASVAALAWAAGEASRRGAVLRVIHARQEHPARAPYAGPAGQQPPEPEPTAAQRLAAWVRTVTGDLPGADVVTEVVGGAPERALAEASDHADLLVLGAGQVSPVAQPDPLIVDRPVGPVIRACLSHARCPVVVIGPGASAGQPGSRAAPQPAVSRA